MDYFTRNLVKNARCQVSHVDQNWRCVEQPPDSLTTSVELPSSVFVFDGFTDLQVNGYQGADFSDPNLSVAQVESLCVCLAQSGVVRFLPTITTNSSAALRASLKNIASAYQNSLLFQSMMVGIHLEGPYISAEDGPRGAHPKQHCRAPNLEEFELLYEESEGLLRLVTLSPEYETSRQFIEAVADRVLVSIGHTAATCQQIRNAVESGARLSTHLGNGMHPVINRHPNYLWEQLASDDLKAGFIADGAHLDAATLSVMLRAKGRDHSFVVSDSTALSGMPIGQYSDSALGEVEVTEDQRLVIAGQRVLNAGAYHPISRSIEFLCSNNVASLDEAIQLASTNPKKILNDFFGTDVEDSTDETFVVAELTSEFSFNVLLTSIGGQPVHISKSLGDQGETE